MSYYCDKNNGVWLSTAGTRNGITYFGIRKKYGDNFEGHISGYCVYPWVFASKNGSGCSYGWKVAEEIICSVIYFSDAKKS